MMISRRLTSLVVLVFLIFLVFLYRQRNVPTIDRVPPAPVSEPQPMFIPGTPKPSGSKYSRTLVMGKLKIDDISWVDEELPELDKAIYVVDDENPNTPFKIPQNKGHEAMVYLTYIIDNYNNLPDTVLFFHPHQVTWHNNVLLSLDTAITIRQLSDPHVARQGYFNSRCHHDPGCPNWLHLDRPEAEWDLIRKTEERFFTSQVWRELHPFAPFPSAISQPCCAQFAVSRDRILTQPRSEYIRYREWLLQTKLEDEVSGRIMEYTWQYLFTGISDWCPSEHACYCDGYGICFGGKPEFDHWLRTLRSRELVDEAVDNLTKEDRGDSPEAERLRKKSSEINNVLDTLRTEAMERGNDPQKRAEEGGRPWKEGDGY